MRRIIGLTLAGVGAFLIVVAILVRTYLPGQLIKFPLNEYLKTQLSGTGVTYFSPSKIHEISGANMLVTSTVKGDAAAGSSSTAVWNGFTYLYDTTNSLPFEYSSRRFAFDRRSAELVTCCGANVGGNSSIKQTGLVGFLWPFGTQQITYQVFDPAINKPEPARFAGTSAIEGIQVNRYVEHVTHVSDGTVTLPGSLVGMSGTSSVTLPEWYTATNTFWVDPETGAQLNTTETQSLTLEDSTGATKLVILDGTLKFTPPSIHTVVGLDNTARSELSLVELILPIVLGVLGLIALVAGIVLAQARRGDQPEVAMDTIPQPAAHGPAS